MGASHPYVQTRSCPSRIWCPSISPLSLIPSILQNSNLLFWQKKSSLEVFGVLWSCQLDLVLDLDLWTLCEYGVQFPSMLLHMEPGP